MIRRRQGRPLARGNLRPALNLLRSGLVDIVGKRRERSQEKPPACGFHSAPRDAPPVTGGCSSQSKINLVDLERPCLFGRGSLGMACKWTLTVAGSLWNVARCIILGLKHLKKGRIVPRTLPPPPSAIHKFPHLLKWSRHTCLRPVLPRAGQTVTGDRDNAHRLRPE